MHFRVIEFANPLITLDTQTVEHVQNVLRDDIDLYLLPWRYINTELAKAYKRVENLLKELDFDVTDSQNIPWSEDFEETASMSDGTSGSSQVQKDSVHIDVSD